MQRSPRKKVKFMDRLRAASSELDLRDLTNDADTSMESMSPITLHVKPSSRFRSSSRYARSNPNLNDSGSGLDSIIADLDTELAKLTDQPLLASSQRSTRSAHSDECSDRLQSSLRPYQPHNIWLAEQRASRDTDVVESEMEFADKEEVSKSLQAADRLRESMSQQIQVKHCSDNGTQLGILLPRYHTRSESKCIRCKDCGIFFTPTAFLSHFHDEFGRRQECNATVLQLNIENPSTHQTMLWEHFQIKIRLISPRKRSAIYTDSLISKHRRHVGGSNKSTSQENLVTALLDSAGPTAPMSRTQDDSALPRQLGMTKRERRPSAPGTLLKKSASTTQLDDCSPSFLNRPVIMSSQNRNSFKSNKNTLQKYLPSRLSAESLKLNLRSYGSLRRASSLTSITSEFVENNAPSLLHKNDHDVGTTEGKVSQNGVSDSADPVYILQTAQELISLAASKVDRSAAVQNEWIEKYEYEKQQRLKSEARVTNLERLLHEERRQRELLENQIRALKTCIG